MYLLVAAILLQVADPPARVAPVLRFPEPGLDDPAAYEGYRSRFYRDARDNTLQVYLNQREGRVVHVWADAANESVGFGVRGPGSAPAGLDWGGDSATVDAAGRRRGLEYRLRVEAPAAEIGHFLLGSMRLERDFQYAEGQREAFDVPPPGVPELAAMIANLERLEPGERRRHLDLLRAGGVEELRERLRPSVSLRGSGAGWSVVVEQPSFDGRNRLQLEIRPGREGIGARLRGGVVTVRSADGGPIALVVRVATDADALTPLREGDVFDAEFLRELAGMRAEEDRLGRRDPADLAPGDRERLLRLRRVERQVRGLELLASREKVMAGLPNYGTYFGRDMLMSALMLRPVWTDEMVEYVIASALRKLSPDGGVSHEEALGGQAVRENAAEYDRTIAAALSHRDAGRGAEADAALARAREILSDLQRVREGYHMVDDDYQLPVLVASYLADPEIPAARRRAFLEAEVAERGGAARLSLILRNLAYVARTAAPYAADPVPQNLVPFPPREEGGWHAASWRDSGAGYAGGRFAMDVNVVWVPAALEAASRIVAALRDLGWTDARLLAASAEAGDSPLARYLARPGALEDAVRRWRGAERHFRVALPVEEVEERVRARLAAMPAEERRYWSEVLDRHPPRGELRFLAVSLDAGGRPIPVPSTDVGMRLYVAAEPGLGGALGMTPEEVLADVRPVTLPYPLGLMISGLGPVVANDAYAAPETWEAWVRDHYHSPRVVWGREVNLLLLGLARQIEAAVDAAGRPLRPELAPYVEELRAALAEIRDAVSGSGLGYQELWTYRIDAGRLVPVRYPTGNEIQLWNLTDLAVQHVLARMPNGAPRGSPGS